MLPIPPPESLALGAMRRSRGLSSEEFAALAGVSSRMITKYENKAAPSPECLDQFAALLGYSPEDVAFLLLALREPPPLPGGGNAGRPDPGRAPDPAPGRPGAGPGGRRRGGRRLPRSPPRPPRPRRPPGRGPGLAAPCTPPRPPSAACSSRRPAKRRPGRSPSEFVSKAKRRPPTTRTSPWSSSPSPAARPSLPPPRSPGAGLSWAMFWPFSATLCASAVICEGRMRRLKRRAGSGRRGRLQVQGHSRPGGSPT